MIEKHAKKYWRRGKSSLTTIIGRVIIIIMSIIGTTTIIIILATATLCYAHYCTLLLQRNQTPKTTLTTS